MGVNAANRELSEMGSMWRVKQCGVNRGIFLWCLKAGDRLEFAYTVKGRWGLGLKVSEERYLIHRALQDVRVDMPQ